MIWVSLIPAIITIVFTFKTKKLIASLFVGVLTGKLVNKGLIGVIIAIGECMMNTLTDKDSAYTLSFLIACGSLAELIEMSGGISGFRV